MPTVLVVDDEFGVAEVLEAILTDEGYAVVLAANGRQALARVGDSQPDVVLVDYMMPALDGVGVLRALAANPAHAGLPVILMSSLPEEAVKSQVDGYAAFLHKPFRVATVLTTLQRVLREREKP